jgi:hypothetical protein
LVLPAPQTHTASFVSTLLGIPVARYVLVLAIPELSGALQEMGAFKEIKLWQWLRDLAREAWWANAAAPEHALAFFTSVRG